MHSVGSISGILAEERQPLSVDLKKNVYKVVTKHLSDLSENQKILQFLSALTYQVDCFHLCSKEGYGPNFGHELGQALILNVTTCAKRIFNHTSDDPEVLMKDIDKALQELGKQVQERLRFLDLFKRSYYPTDNPDYEINFYPTKREIKSVFDDECEKRLLATVKIFAEIMGSLDTEGWQVIRQDFQRSALQFSDAFMTLSTKNFKH